MARPQRHIPPASAGRHTFICAWCKVVLRSSPDPSSATENYGICPRCLETQLQTLAPIDGAQVAKGQSPAS